MSSKERGQRIRLLGQWCGGCSGMYLVVAVGVLPLSQRVLMADFEAILVEED